MIIGYARVSTKAQNTDMQVDALKRYGCDKIYTEKEHGTVINRSQFAKALEQVSAGDTFVVYDIRRLGRTIKQLVNIIERFRNDGINLISLKDGIDTSNTQGRFLVYVICAMAEMEREVIVERTRNGLEAARARGRRGGRPPVPKDIQKRVVELYKTGMFSCVDIAKTCGIGRTTLYYYLRKEGVLKTPSEKDDK